MVERVLAALRAAGPEARGHRPLRLRHGPRAAPRRPRRRARPLPRRRRPHQPRGRRAAPTCLFTRASGGGVEALAVELAERSALTLEHARGWLAHVGLAGARRGHRGRRRDRRARPPGPARRRAPHRRRGAQLARLPPHAGRRRHGVARGDDRARQRRSPASTPRSPPSSACPVEQGLVDGAPAGLDAGRVTVAAGLAVEEAPA